MFDRLKNLLSREGYIMNAIIHGAVRLIAEGAGS